MSTNYYVKTGRKEKVICNLGCEHEIDEILHLGKSALGWKFALHVIPEKGINELEDWKDVLKNGEILSECNEKITFEKIIEIITKPKFTSTSTKSPLYIDSRCSYDYSDDCYYLNEDPIGKEGGHYCLVSGDFS